MTKPGGQANRQSEYGIYQIGEHPALYARYEGCRYDSPTGQVQVGLPLAGPQASHNQPLIDFRPGDYETIRFFDAEPAEATAVFRLKLEMPALSAWPETELRQVLWSTSPRMSSENGRLQQRFQSILKSLVAQGG